MGLKRMVYYTIKCNKCGAPVEDFAGELIERDKEEIKRTALSFGYKQTGMDTWYCPNCVQGRGN